MIYIIIYSIILILLVIYLLISFQIFKVFFKCPKKPIKYKNDLHTKYDFSIYSNYILNPLIHDIDVDSYHGFHLKAKYLKAPVISHSYYVALHGYHGSYMAHSRMNHLVSDYLKANSILLILPGDKESNYKYNSLGGVESFYLLAMLSYIKEHDPSAIFYLYGVSMGAAILIFNASKYDNSVKGVIADSGFASLSNEVHKTIITHFKIDIYSPLIKLFYFLKFHHKMDEFNDESLKTSTVPFLFLHGSEDKVVSINDYYHHLRIFNPTIMMKHRIMEGVPHAILDVAEREVYFKLITDFISKTTP
jgi:pimeloyl-ACP methyl ester carboxylesterase